MIPNALASTGAYADFWSHLKSIDHALERCMDPKIVKIDQLDKERLSALASFLRENFSTISRNSFFSTDLDSFYQTTASSFAPDFDLKQKLQEVPALKSWHRGSKMGIEKKVERLINAIDDFLSKTSEDIFKKNVPQDEFKILREILKDLLNEMQSALYM